MRREPTLEVLADEVALTLDAMVELRGGLTMLKDAMTRLEQATAELTLEVQGFRAQIEQTLQDDEARRGRAEALERTRT